MKGEKNKMIIISQDKETIVNFDNTQMLGLEEYEKTQIVCEGLFKIGEYKTEERAKEVLQNLIQSYREYRTAEVDGYTNVLEETAVFEMPKE